MSFYGFDSHVFCFKVSFFFNYTEQSWLEHKLCWDKLERKCLITGGEDAPPLQLGFQDNDSINQFDRKWWNWRQDLSLFVNCCLKSYWLHYYWEVSFQSQFCTRWRTFYRIQWCDGKPKMTNARYGISLFLFQQPQLPFSHEIGPQSTSSNQFPNASTLFCVWHYVLEAGMWTEGVPLLGGTHVKRTRRQPRLGTCVAFPMYQYCPTSFPVLQNWNLRTFANLQQMVS